METKKSIAFVKQFVLLLLLASIAQNVSAQKIWEVRKGSFRAQGNLAPGYLFSQKFFAAYVTGDMDLFIDDRFAVSGSCWISFAAAPKNTEGLLANHSIFGGVNYHFLKPKHFDPFIGITPGMALVKTAYKDNEGVLKKSKFSAAPLVSFDAGFNYYVGSIFHFFLKAQTVVGQTFGDAPSPNRLDELKLTAGLGFNFRAWKPKIKDNWK